MARTLEAATRGKAKKREKPLGAALALGLAATLVVSTLIILIQFLDPHSALHNFVLLVHYNASATLPLDPLYQKWYEQLSKEDVLYVSTFSLFCGGLVLGWLAPSYETRRRVLLAGTGLGLGLPLICLAFLWVGGVMSQNLMNAHEGGEQVGIAAPPSLILAQAGFVLLWAACCVLGTLLGRWLRERSRSARQSGSPTASA